MPTRQASGTRNTDEIRRTGGNRGNRELKSSLSSVLSVASCSQRSSFKRKNTGERRNM
jgi:hypothetical protein